MNFRFTHNFLNSVALNISAMVYQHNHGSINIDNPVSEGFYVVQFTPMPYTLQYSIKLNGNKITEGKLVCDKKILLLLGKVNSDTLIQKLDQYIPQFL